MVGGDERDAEKHKIEVEETKSTLRLLRRQAIHVIILTHIPKPSWEQAEKIAEKTSHTVLDEKRWHDFLEPKIVRKVAVNLEHFLQDKPPKYFPVPEY
jgi:hypothetical protein